MHRVTSEGDVFRVVRSFFVDRGLAYTLDPSTETFISVQKPCNAPAQWEEGNW